MTKAQDKLAKTIKRFADRNVKIGESLVRTPNYSRKKKKRC